MQDEYKEAADRLLDRLRAPAQRQAQLSDDDSECRKKWVVINQPQNCTIFIGCEGDGGQRQ